MLKTVRGQHCVGGLHEPGDLYEFQLSTSGFQLAFGKLSLTKPLLRGPNIADAVCSLHVHA